MKIKFQYIWLLFLIISVASCKKDNFKAPSSTLSGKIHYKGEAIQVEYDRVPLQLYQYGFGRVGAIDFRLSPEGTYSTQLFDGQYKFIIPNNQGPFKWNKTSAGDPDSVTINMKGNQTLDFEVTPYYMPRNGVASSRGRNITASFKTEQIIAGVDAKDIEYVSVFINKTQFASSSDQIAARRYNNDAIIDNNKIEFTKFIAPASVLQNYYFLRLAIKVAGVEDLILTPLIKVDVTDIENYKRMEIESATLVGNAIIDSTSKTGSGNRFVKGISGVGDGVDITINAPTAGTYILNIGGGTDIKGSTQQVYIDGNVGTSKTVLFPKQGSQSFDISAVEFDLTAGIHVVSIRKTAANVGEANLDYMDFFKLK